MTRALYPCGTYPAARRHHARGEELDEACRDAQRRYWRGEREPHDVDEVAVERAAAGEQVPLTPAERAAAAALIWDRGGSTTAARRRLGLSGRQAREWRERAA